MGKSGEVEGAGGRVGEGGGGRGGAEIEIQGEEAGGEEEEVLGRGGGGGCEGECMVVGLLWYFKAQKV